MGILLTFGLQYLPPSPWTSKMGTNYYWINEGTICPHCGHRGLDKRHIGKSSAGWCFSLHVDETIKSLDDWIELFETGYVEDEYERYISNEELIETITERSHPISFDDRDWTMYENEAEFHRKNNSERGPNNLLRHKIGPYCIGHGPGTWDLITGDFS